MRSRIGILVALMWFVTIGEAAAKGPPAQPPELLATLSLGPASALDPLRDFLDTVKPGTRAALTEPTLRQLIAAGVGAASIDALDWTAPMYFLAIDTGGAGIGRAVVGKIKDEKKLVAGLGSARSAINAGWALVASDDTVISKVGSYALDTLPASAPQSSPSLAINVPRLLIKYRTQIAAGQKAFVAQLAAQQGSTQMTRLMQSMVDGTMSLAGDTDQVVLSLEASKDSLAVALALVPKARSRLAKFAAAQRPADYALLAKLPATTAGMVIAGKLDGGPYRQALLEMWAMVYGQGVADKDLVRALDAILKASTGDVAMTWSLGGGKPMQFAQVFGITDQGAVDRSVAKVLAWFKTPRTFESSNSSTTIQTNPTLMEHDGVKFGTLDMTFDYSKATEPVRKQMATMMPTSTLERVGTLDKYGIVTMNSDPGPVVDQLRGKGPAAAPDPALTAILDASRARKESLVMTMDLLAMMGRSGAPFLITSGFADGSVHLRLAMPAAGLRAFTP